ncbi:MAG: GIY-YIG nuclease family protein [Armatimonadota bacterium]
MQYFVYILQCLDGTYYVGHTHDISQRLIYHNEGRGASYTQLRRPVKLMYSEACADLETALTREKQIKNWSHVKKAALITGNLNHLHELAKSHD